MRPAISGEYQFKKVAHTHDMFRLLNGKKKLTSFMSGWLDRRQRGTNSSIEWRFGSLRDSQNDLVVQVKEVYQGTVILASCGTLIPLRNPWHSQMEKHRSDFKI